jgi:formate C-acetyltransferase
MLDFSHTTAHWESVIPLGIWGLRERVREYAARPDNTEKQARFYSCVDRAYTASLNFMNRCADEAEKAGKTEMAKSLRALTTRSPETLFEAMQTSIVYYILQHVFDGTYLRTLGRLDALFYPYYVKEQDPQPLLRDFLMEIDRLNAPSNIPYAIGGSTPDGKSAVNDLTYALLHTYQTVPTHNTKFHVLCRPDTPDDLIKQTFRGIVNGQNSVVFLSDETVTQSLIRLGADETDARNYHIVGCYECGADGELTCSCNART